MLKVNHHDLPPIAALQVSASDSDHDILNDIFASLNWKLDRVCSIHGAISRMLSCVPPVVVICEQSLGDGDWKTLLNEIQRLPRPPQLIVSTARIQEALLAEVLNLGGYEVLHLPFEVREVAGLVSSAWAEWHTRRVQSRGEA